MKNYGALVEFWRESFNGHDCLDDTETFHFKARNFDSAKNKVSKLATKSLAGNWSQARWFKVKEIKETVDVTTRR